LEIIAENLDIQANYIRESKGEKFVVDSSSYD
jgi:hypothetical protein